MHENHRFPFLHYASFAINKCGAKMIKNFLIATLILLSACISACRPAPGENPDTTSNTAAATPVIEYSQGTESVDRWHACDDPRPEICTHRYQPVCGLTDTGVRCITTPCPSTGTKTFGNACVACSDESVSAYYPGECDSEDGSPGNKTMQDSY